MMNNKVVIGTVAVFLVVIAVVLFSMFGNQNSQNTLGNDAEGDSGASLLYPAPGNDGVDEMIVNSDEGTTPQEFFVEITSSGFSPQTLEINQGDTVTWTNKKSSDSWPASAVHPTHDVYPEFDANRGLKTGETYSFTFERVGNWKYHDHLNPSVTGTIVVK